MNRRTLSDEESALWSDFVRSIAPLRPAKAKPTSKALAPGKVSPHAVARPEPVPRPRPLPLMPFDRRLKQRVARGREVIEARIDLHGMTQQQAYSALLRFLHGAQAAGKRMALVVTGKGSGGHDRDRGVLRRQVPLWLTLPEFRLFVLGFEEAHVGHGGQGALYVRLRRAG